MKRLAFIVLWLTGGAAFSQDLDQIRTMLKKPGEAASGMLPNLKKGIRISGMAGANLVYYQAAGIEGRNIPFNTLFTGNLVVDLFGKIKMPVGFSLSNQNINWSHPFDRRYQFMQPFNRIVLKPTYKGFTLHAGVCALNFSPYTLAGHRYDGIGLEYKPAGKPFYVGIMYGNLQRAVRIDTSYTSVNNQPSYKRTGAGFQVGYRKQADRLELTFFTAWDKPGSLPYTLDSVHITPQRNAVVSLKGGKLWKKKWLAEGEIAVSGLTNDLRAVTVEGNFLQRYGGILPATASTEYKKALKAGLSYKGKGFMAGAEYSRIDPGYRTLGAYYFANDLETFAGKFAGQFGGGKLTLSANAGLQQDNVQKQKLKTLRRWVGAANVSFVPSQSLTMILSYSNFTSFSNLRSTYDYLRQVTPYQSLDTLNYRQINQNVQAGVNYQLPGSTPERTQLVSVNATLQRGADQQGNLSSANNLTNLSADYTLTLRPQKLSLGLSGYYSSSSITGIDGTQWGPSLTAQKGFGDKWKMSLSTTYSAGKMTGGPAPVTQRTWNARYGLSAALLKQLNLTFNLIYLNRQNASTERVIPSFREFTATTGLVYQFSVL